MFETYDSGTATPTTIPIGGYTMLDFAFDDTPSGSTSSVAAPGGGAVVFERSGGSLVNLNVSTANTKTWWVNGEVNDDLTSKDYNIFTTDYRSIDFILPTNTLAFSFNVGYSGKRDANSTASHSATAWFTATETAGPGIGTQTFGVSTSNTPGIGIYADNSGASSSAECSYISKITVDPEDLWGFGNFSISTGDCAAVPEPSILALFGVGLIGLGLVSRRRVS
jgi:hypothetical protein